MGIQEFVKLLRSRWVTVCVITAAALLGSLIYTWFTTPLYQASTRMFVSTTSGASLADLYEGSRFSQERVLSYTQLLMGENLAQRTINKLGLEMDPKSLQEEIKATAKPDTVLIDVSVLDRSPTRARDIANALSDEFVQLVAELETPPNAKIRPDSRVVVEQRASIPTKPLIPNPPRNITLGLAVGLLLGIGAAILRDRLDNTIKDRETLESITEVGTVGSIPLDKERRREPAISFDKENSGIAEAFRKLRTNLQYVAVDDPPRVIVVTSSSPSEGKSTTAINIALALAEAEHNVVLVDGDMRRPSLDKYLDLVGSVGFSTVLSGGTSLSEALQKTRFPRLTVLAAGAAPPNPSELLGSLAAKAILSELRAKFDYVIVDSSPLLAVTDGAILAVNSDGALIIAQHGSTKRDQLTHAVGSLKGVGARLLGAIFTMTPSRGGASYSYSYSYYGEDQSARETVRQGSTGPVPEQILESPSAEPASPLDDDDGAARGVAKPVVSKPPSP